MNESLNLMPVPEKVSLQPGRFPLSGAFTVSVGGDSGPRLRGAAERFLRRLGGRTGLFFSRETVGTSGANDRPGLKIACDRAGRLQLGEDESYRLNVKPEGIDLSAPTDLGALHGLETLLQLLAADREGYYFPCLRVEDRPRFPWRGVLFDVCRHFLPLDVIRHNLDGMAMVKMNVLHLHLSEDQGFRIECKTFPKLHQLGSDGLYYSQDEIRGLIAYAAERGIRVVPEFDIPGHSTSWLVGYPELASAPGPYGIERGYGVKDPTFNPTLKRTYKFFGRFFVEMSKLFPDAYMHIGGDEVNGKQWNGNADIQAFMKRNGLKDNHSLQAYFNRKILRILEKCGKTMVGWDEIYQPDLPRSIVIHSWRGKEALVDAARRGFPVILSNGYYIDLNQPTDFHYLNDPVPDDSPLSADERKRVLGGEATMWSEIVTEENVDSRVWPRTAAIAERLWSAGEIRDVDGMYRRLDVVDRQLEEAGLTHLKNREMMLRRLAGGGDPHPLWTLAGAIEPLTGYDRHKVGVIYTSYSPFTRMVDAAVADPRPAREFGRGVDRFLSGKDENAIAGLQEQLVCWKENHRGVRTLAERSPVLREIETLSEELSASAALGLEALEILTGKRKAGPSWGDEAKKAIEKAGMQRGELELAILPALAKLVTAASGN